MTDIYAMPGGGAYLPPTPVTPAALPAVRLSMTYPAVTGEHPESVELEWAQAPSIGELMAVLSCVLGAEADPHG